MLSEKFFYFSSVLCLATGRNLIVDDKETLGFLTISDEWTDHGFKATNTTDDPKSSREKRAFHQKMDERLSVLWPNGVIPFRISRHFDQGMRSKISSAIDYIERVSKIFSGQKASQMTFDCFRTHVSDISLLEEEKMRWTLLHGMVVFVAGQTIITTSLITLGLSHPTLSLEKLNLMLTITVMVLESSSTSSCTL